MSTLISSPHSSIISQFHNLFLSEEDERYSRGHPTVRSSLKRCMCQGTWSKALSVFHWEKRLILHLSTWRLISDYWTLKWITSLTSMNRSTSRQKSNNTTTETNTTPDGWRATVYGLRKPNIKLSETDSICRVPAGLLQHGRSQNTPTVL